MKVSVSLPEEDIRFLDSFVEESRVPSRSAAVHLAVASLRASQLEAAYEQAWREWQESGDDAAWDAAAPDGLDAAG